MHRTLLMQDTGSLRIWEEGGAARPGSFGVQFTAAVHAREKFMARSFTSCAPVASRHDLSGLYSNEPTVANDCGEGISQWSKRDPRVRLPTIAILGSAHRVAKYRTTYRGIACL